MADFEIPKRISCLLDEDEQAGVWVGHCLDFDLVTSGDTPDIAWTNLKSVVKLHIEHCFTHNRGALCAHQASDEDFEVFKKICKTELFRSDKIRLNLVAPKPPDQLSFWIQGVEIGFPAHAEVSAVH